MSGRIRKNDTVIVITGASSGKTGKVMQLVLAKNRAIVEGLNLVTKALRKTKDSPQGGLIKKEASIHASNLLLYCPTCKKGVRIKQFADGDKKVRKCTKCSHAFDG